MCSLSGGNVLCQRDSPQNFKSSNPISKTCQLMIPNRQWKLVVGFKKITSPSSTVSVLPGLRDPPPPKNSFSLNSWILLLWMALEAVISEMYSDVISPFLKKLSPLASPVAFSSTGALVIQMKRNSNYLFADLKSVRTSTSWIPPVLKNQHFDKLFKLLRG